MSLPSWPLQLEKWCSESVCQMLRLQPLIRFSFDQKMKVAEQHFGCFAAVRALAWATRQQQFNCLELHLSKLQLSYFQLELLTIATKPPQW